MKYPYAFYVYMLVDPMSGSPFYVGKGMRSRAWQHAEAVGRGNLSGNSRKVAKIQEILDRGDMIEIQIVAEYELERDALDHEFELVSSTLGLTNIMPGGGGGTSGPRLTAAEIARRIADREARLATRKATQASLRSAHEARVISKYAEMARSQFQADELAGWLETARSAIVVGRRNEVSIRGANHGGNQVSRDRRSEREQFLLKTGKLVEVTLPNGKKRLQSVS